jgi:hypothetical protein
VTYLSRVISLHGKERLQSQKTQRHIPHDSECRLQRAVPQSEQDCEPRRASATNFRHGKLPRLNTRLYTNTLRTAKNVLLLRNEVSYVLRDGLSVHLLGRMLQSNQIAARRFRGLAGRVLDKLRMIRSCEEFTLFC